VRKDFVHLHVHSAYSLLDGASRISDIVGTAAEFGMPAVALTDHGVLYGAVEFVKAAAAAGIKPIVGVEAYVTDDVSVRNKDAKYWHLILLAATDEGYRNINYLVSRAFKEGFYYRPRIQKSWFEGHTSGIIALSACVMGEVQQKLLRGGLSEAESAALWYKDVFPDGFYLEIMYHGMREEEQIIEGFKVLSEKLDIPLVATNDTHYTSPDDWQVQQILMAIASSKGRADDFGVFSQYHEFYIKSPQEMWDIFDGKFGIPQALLNTLEIAEKINFSIPLGNYHMPRFPLPAGFETEFEFLRHLVYTGLKEKYGDNPPAEVVDRLEKELGIIHDMGFDGYFLIVQEYVNWAKDRGIMVGPGRGSAVGSLVAYLLGITDIDPLRYGLLFERFLNPERRSMPDIDVDFDAERRDEVIRHVVEFYGEDKVAQIITFGTMASKAAVRDVGRVKGYPRQLVDKVSKAIPQGMSIDRALSESSALKILYNEDPRVRELVDTAKRIEGLPRHSSTHAAGVVIADAELFKYVPLQYDESSVTGYITQYAKDEVEEVGLLKMDFLGLRNLTIIQDALKLIRDYRGEEVSLEELTRNPNDPEVYRLLSSGEVLGVFQVESEGFREFLKRLKPQRFEDIIAALSLYRPGTLASGGAEMYIRRKHGLEEPDYYHEDLKEILEETYGVIVYQEQIMQIASKMAGFTLGEADILRRAIGKKKLKLMQKMKDKFIAGGVRKGYTQELMEKIWNVILKFAEYGFNKSHSTAYAMITYWTGWLKVHYPREYMAAVLTSVAENSDKLVRYILATRRMGIEVLPPDINESEIKRFVPSGENFIRASLVIIKGVGAKELEKLIEERESGGPFKSFEDFLSRARKVGIRQNTIELLIKGGALDRFGDRQELYKRFVSGGGQNQLLFGVAEDDVEIPSPGEMEFSALGFYLKYHPLESVAGAVKSLRQKVSAMDLSRTDEIVEGVKMAGERQTVKVVAMVTSLSEKGGKTPIGVATLDDLTGKLRVYITGKALLDIQDYVGRSGLLEIWLDFIPLRNGDVRPYVSKVGRFWAVEDISGVSSSMKRLRLTLPPSAWRRDMLVKLAHMLGQANPKRLKIRLRMPTKDGSVVDVILPVGYAVPSIDYLHKVLQRIGIDGFKIEEGD